MSFFGPPSRSLRVAASWLATALVVVACGGGAPGQAPLVKLEIEGTAYGSDGKPLPSAGARVRGSKGVGRTANPLNGTTRYNVSVSNLEPPYLIESGSYTIAFAPGTSDISPLTSLVVGALFGRNDTGLY